MLEDSWRALGTYNLRMSEILEGQAAGGVYKLLGAGLHKIICFGRGGDIFGSVSCPEVTHG